MDLLIPRNGVWAAEEIYNPVIGRLGEWTSPEDWPGVISGFFKVMIMLMIIIGIITAIGYFIIGAYTWMSAAGDKSRLQEAQHRLRDAIVGLLIIFSLFAVLRLLGEVFGIDLLKLPIPTITEVLGG